MHWPSMYVNKNPILLFPLPVRVPVSSSYTSLEVWQANRSRAERFADRGRFHLPLHNGHHGKTAGAGETQGSRGKVKTEIANVARRNLHVPG